MPRLPIVGSDDGTWGTYLNEFLEVSLDNTNVDLAERGKLKSAAVDDAGAVMNSDTSTASMSFVVDEDNMASNSATKVPTQQSVKTYADTKETKAKVTPIAVSTATAAATAAKVATTVGGSYTPVLGDIIFVTFTTANTATNPTINIDGSGAKSILLGNLNPTGVAMAGTKVMMWYDGTAFQLFGSQRVSDTDTNTTYIEATAFATVSGTTQAAAVNQGYIANNAAQVNVTLPGTVAIGQIVHVLGLGAGGWRVTAPSGDNIILEGNSTGAAGYIYGGQYASVALRCIVANATWEVVSYTGDITTGVGYSTAKQPLDADLTTLAGAGNSTVLAATTASFLTADETKLDGIEALADVTDATNVDAAGAVMNTDTATTDMQFVVDEDDMVSNSATKIPTQQSTKAYIDNSLHEGTEPGTAGIKNKHLDRWFTAMANAKTTPVNIVTFGDSISGSIFNNNYDNSNDRLSWSAKLANLLNKRLGISTATSGFLYAKGDSAAPSMTETNGSNPASLFTWGLGGWAVELDNTEYVRQESSMDGISIMYIKHSNGGQMRIRDGGASGTILATIDTYAATTEVGHVWDSSALTYASHNIYIENIDAGKVVVVEACYVHSGTLSKGFRVWQSCHGGWWTTFWTLYPNIGINQVARMQPDLIISAGGTNDDTGNIATRNQDLIDALQAAAPDTDIVMWIPYIGATYTTADRELLIGVAETNNLAYVDATVTMGSLVLPPFLFDTIHPNETGRTMIATQVYQVIGGDPFGTPLYEAVKAQIPTLTKTWKGSNGTLSVDQFFESMALQGTPISGDGFGLYPSYLWSAINGLPGAGLKLGSLYLAKASADELTMGTSTKLILADPTGATHAATKGYVDSGTITMTNKTLTSPVLNTGVSGTAIVDEDDMASNSATKIPTQQSTKAYVDNAVTVTGMPGALPYRSKYLDNWLAKLKDSNDAGPLNIIIVGDSIASGSSTDSPTARGWGWVLSDLFARKDYLSRYPDTPDVAQVEPDGWTPALADWGKTMTSCQGTATNTGLGRYSSTMSNGQVAYHTATLDAVSVVYNVSPTGGQIEVRDGPGGTLLTTIETNGTTAAAQMWTSSALTYGSHTIHLTAVCGGGESVVLNGVYCYSGNLTRGIRVWPAARAGINTDTARTDTTFFLDFIDTINPDLVVLATGANDSAANYTSRMQSLIDDTRARTSADIALWGCYPITRLAKYLESQSVLARNIALSNNLQIIDAFLALPDMRQGLYFRDNLHPNDKGVKILAWHAYSVLSGDPLGFTMRELSTKAEQSSLDTLTTTVNTKAPIANPTFTGTVTGNLTGNVTGGVNLSNGANGSLQIVSFFGYPALLLYNNAADANGAIAFFGAPLATLIGYSTTAAIVFGAGGASAVDAGLARTGASEMTFYGTSSATKSTVNVADPTSASHAATKAYVDSGTVTMTNKTLTSPVINTGVSGTAILDEDNMASNSATQLATQQSIKAYVDSRSQTLMADSGGGAVSNTANEKTRKTGGITNTPGTTQKGGTGGVRNAGNMLDKSGGSITNNTRLKFNGTAINTQTYAQGTSSLALRYMHEFKATRMSSTTLLLTGKWYLSNTTNVGVARLQVVQGSECTVTVSNMDSNDLTIDNTFQWASASPSATTTPYAVRAQITKG